MDGYAQRLTTVQPAAQPRLIQPTTPVKYTDEEINNILNNVYRGTYGREANFETPNKTFLDKLAMSK